MATVGEHDSLFIGLISGTSMDGIDAALVRLGDRRCEIVAALAHPYPDELRQRLIDVSRDPHCAGVDDIGRLDHRVGQCFADAALALLEQAGRSPAEIAAIGSHGQTLRHRPDDATPFTLQIGDPNIIANATGITTAADFRRRDMAAGGEGAPLAPAFHHWLFAEPGRVRAVLNVGGIANVTILPGDDPEVTGFDTGPANTLLDAWIRRHRGQPFDADGRWARSGRVEAGLLAKLVEDPYFSRPAPKSTGFEHFNLEWLDAALNGSEPAAEDVQATLLELSVVTIADAVRQATPDDVLVCGGGVHNACLMERLADTLSPVTVASTATHGLDPDWVEAAAFGWLASRTLAAKPGNLPSVTGASGFQVLGGLYVCTS